MTQNTDGFVILLYCKLPSCGWGISPLINRKRGDVPWPHRCEWLFLWKQCHHSSSLGIQAELYLNKYVFTLLFQHGSGYSEKLAVSRMPAAVPSQIGIFK